MTTAGRCSRCPDSLPPAMRHQPGAVYPHPQKVTGVLIHRTRAVFRPGFRYS